MQIFENFNKNNLHHAYLIEGKKEEVIPEILAFMQDIGVETLNNPDFNQIVIDSFKIENARNLKSQSAEKGISKDKKVFLISTNSFLVEAQNTLLKMFEEPIENTHFFLIVPDIAIILPTLLSRFYLIKTENNLKDEMKQAEKFLEMSLNERINFLKEFTAKRGDDKEEEVENFVQDSVRAKSIRFLNALEKILHQKFLSKLTPDIKIDYFYQILKVREFLSQPGSSIKSLLESVALILPK